MSHERRSSKTDLQLDTQKLDQVTFRQIAGLFVSIIVIGIGFGLFARARLTESHSIIEDFRHSETHTETLFCENLDLSAKLEFDRDLTSFTKTSLVLTTFRSDSATARLTAVLPKTRKRGRITQEEITLDLQRAETGWCISSVGIRTSRVRA